MNKSLAEELSYAVFRFKKSSVSFSSEFDVRIGEFYIMKNILESSFDPNKNTFMPEIQDSLRVTKPAVSQMLNSLENKGYIKREINPNDRRKINITVTNEGKEVVNSMQEQVDRAIAKRIGLFGEENTRLFIDLINRFADISEEVNNENSSQTNPD